MSLNDIKTLAARSNRLVYAFNTCWWKVGDPIYSKNGLPCGPRGEMLLETDDPISFIKSAEEFPRFYGKHGIDAKDGLHHLINGKNITN
jgi:hypothetical protein